jgi:ribosome-binding protein aMBF1 (putative translation factor)
VFRGVFILVSDLDNSRKKGERHLEDHELFAKVLGKHLRLRRMMKGMSLEDLAELANLDNKNLGRIERGTISPMSQTLFKIVISPTTSFASST